MAKLTFDDYEIEAMRMLAGRFHLGGNRIGVTEFPRYEEVGQEKVERTIARFKQYNFVEWETNSSLTILPDVCELIYQLDNPPPRDYWKDVEVWFRARWWSVPLVAFVVLLPIIAQWIQWAWDIFRWVAPK